MLFAHVVVVFAVVIVIVVVVEREREREKRARGGGGGEGGEEEGGWQLGSRLSGRISSVAGIIREPKQGQKVGGWVGGERRYGWSDIIFSLLLSSLPLSLCLSLPLSPQDHSVVYQRHLIQAITKNGFFLVFLFFSCFFSFSFFCFFFLVFFSSIYYFPLPFHNFNPSPPPPPPSLFLSSSDLAGVIELTQQETVEINEIRDTNRWTPPTAFCMLFWSCWFVNTHTTTSLTSTEKTPKQHTHTSLLSQLCTKNFFPPLSSFFFFSFFFQELDLLGQIVLQ